MEGHELTGSRIWAVCTDESLDLGVNIPVATDLWATGRIKGLCCACLLYAAWFYSDILWHYSFIHNFLRMLGRK